MKQPLNLYSLPALLVKMNLFLIPLYIIYIFSYTIIWFFNKTSIPFEYIYQYQVNRIDSASYDTVLLGDSSLGNAINETHFSKLTSTRSINFALTGVYGLAGSYNMLKKCYKKNPDLKNAIIIHTIDIFQRSDPYYGYAYTMGFTDFLELTCIKRIKVFVSTFDIRLNLKAKLLSFIHPASKIIDRIQNNYIKQGPPKLSIRNDARLSREKINYEQFSFLKQIISFCEAHRINLCYIHGPLYNSTVTNSQDYINVINNSLKELEIIHAAEVVRIPKSDIGDSGDHVKPDCKNTYTEKFAFLYMNLNDWQLKSH